MESLLVYNKYTDSEFEIIIEGYYGNTTTYTGWLREDGKRPVTAIMYVWNSGDMVYNVKNKRFKTTILYDNYLEKKRY
ncbi:hypothetical protein [Streptococcus sp.]